MGNLNNKSAMPAHEADLTELRPDELQKANGGSFVSSVEDGIEDVGHAAIGAVKEFVDGVKNEAVSVAAQDLRFAMTVSESISGTKD